MMGDATDEEWQRRLEKRRNFIERIKSGPDYTRRADDSGQAAPRTRTPDPTARTSKRQWEKETAEWRKGLRQP